MAKGIGLQLASLGSSRQGTAKYIPKKNDKTRNSRKKTPVKKTTSRVYLGLPRWWPGTPWPIRFAPICEGTC